MRRMAGTLELEDRGGVAVFTLKNPSKRNALDLALCGRLAEALGAAAGRGTRAIVLTGDGDRAFSAGFDLAELKDGARVEQAFGALMEAVAACPVPIVCALNGQAVGGGCELAAACDIRLAHPGVRLMMPPARLGIVYRESGLVRFSALIGESRARRMFLAGEWVSAELALAWGLVDEVVGDYELLPRASDRAADIAALAPLAVQGMRRSFELLLKQRAALSEASLLERLRAEAWASQDALEARAALAEGRKPEFQGK